MKRQNTRYFTAEEKDRFLRSLEKCPQARRSEMFFKLMFKTGLRLQEAVNLNVSDVSEKNRLIIQGKGNKIREVPLSEAVKSEIKRFLEWKQKRGEDLSSEAPFFISRKNRRLGCRAVQHDLDKWVKQARLEGKYSPHALRHTVGFELMHKTGNIRQVQEFLGHSSITTTQIYTHVTKEQLQKCAELLDI